MATSFVRGDSSFSNSCDSKLAAPIDRRDFERGPGLLADQLPGHDVRVMFQGGDEDLVARAEARARVGLSHQVDGLGGAHG